MSFDDLRFDTKRIHAGYDSGEHFHSVNIPIYQTAAFDLDDIDRARSLWSGEIAGGIYTRVGNPTVTVLEERIRDLDGGSAAIGLSSGMAAISYTILLLGERGGNVVVSSSLYGAAQEAFVNFYPKFGIETKFVSNRGDASAYESLIDENTRAVYIESISNPNAEIYDFEAIAEAAHRHHIPLVVDNTVATPFLFRPFEHGADIIVYSATKGISGHGSTIAGLVVESGKFTYTKERFPHFHEKSYKIRDLEENPRTPLEAAPHAPVTTALRAFYLEFIGASLSAFDAYLVLQGLCTISERLSKQVATTGKLVEYLEARPEVTWVRYPTAKNSPYKELASKYFPDGSGALFSFGFGGTREQFKKFIKALNVFSYHVNIGDVRSLIVNSPETTHAELRPEYRDLAGIPAELVRISVGLEDSDDLIHDLDRGFRAAFSAE